MSWSDLVAKCDRYIIQLKEGLIQVIRAFLKGGTNVPASSAGKAIDGE
jgi:hypothetical protein